MSNDKLKAILAASMKSGVAILPLAIACAQMPASAQTPAPAAKTTPTTKKSAAELKAEADAAKAAAAQEDAAQADDKAAAVAAGGATGKDIVVTGTSIRGAAPTGTNLITIGAEEVATTGATGGSQLLATVPQIGGNFFNAIPQAESGLALAAGGVNQTTNKPTLRPVPTTGGTNDTGNSTLILVDGLRQSGIGVNGLAANPDAAPPALLERVELNTDGASAVYGSDATGGVINYVTRRKFDGIQIAGRFGYSDDYQTYDVNGIAGKDWGSGSAYISYSYSHNDPLFNRDRSFVRNIDWTTGLATGLNCNNPNVRFQSTGANPVATTTHYYAVSAAGVPGTAQFTVVAPVAGTANVCNLNLDATLVSENSRHNVLANFAQDIGDSVKLTVRGRYSKQNQIGIVAPQTFTGVVAQSILVNNVLTPVNNPFFRPVGPTGSTDIATPFYSVLGNFRPALGDQKEYSNSSTQYGGNAELSWDIDGNFQFRGIANYDQSKSYYSNPTYNPTAIANGFNGTASTPCSLTRTAAVCFNPFNIAASDPALLATLTNWQDIGRSRDKILNFKGTVDGALFTLPGGKVRMAFGVEYFKDTFSKGNSQALPGTPISLFTVKQTNKSVFGELNIPIVSSANAMPIVRELRLSIQGRYDKYSGIDGVFNPRFGASYKPVNWLTLRGTWGKTFRAPTAPDLVGTSKLNTTISAFAANTFNSFLVDPTHPITPGLATTAQAIILLGTQPGVKPQKGINWSVSADITPFQGFRASVSYFSIDYIGTLGNPASGNPFFPGLAHLATLCPLIPVTLVYDCTPAQIAALANQANNPTNIAAVDRSLIYGLYDARRTNLGQTKTGGIDYSMRYSRKTGFGSIFANVSGNIILENRTSVSPGQPFISTIALNTTTVSQARGSLHKMTAQVGMTAGGLRATATLQHSDGFPVIRSVTLLQDRVADFNVINTFVSYDFPNTNVVMRNLQLSLGIDNILNTSPPIYRTGNGYTNGSTRGRIATVGIQKRF